jgi:hypothetical protein
MKRGWESIQNVGLEVLWCLSTLRWNWRQNSYMAIYMLNGVLAVQSYHEVKGNSIGVLATVQKKGDEEKTSQIKEGMKRHFTSWQQRRNSRYHEILENRITSWQYGLPGQITRPDPHSYNQLLWPILPPPTRLPSLTKIQMHPCAPE